MNKNFTDEDIIKKLETNVKSATSGVSLAGILGIIYVVRFFISGNFNFYFSITFTELMLRLGDAGKLSPTLSYIAVAVFLAAYLAVVALAVKNAKNLRLCLGLYLADCLCFIPLFIFHGSIQPDYFIDVIVHLFVVIFLSVGVISEKKLRADNK